MKASRAFYRHLRIDLAGMLTCCCVLIWCGGQIAYESNVDPPVITISILNGAAKDVLTSVLKHEPTIVSVQDVGYDLKPGILSVAIALPEFSSDVYLSHIMKRGDSFACAEVTGRRSFENFGQPLASASFEETNLTSPADNAKLVRIDVSNLHYLNGTGPKIECDLDVVPLRQSIEERSLAFVNHGIATQSSQLSFHIEYNQISGASNFTSENEVQSRRISDRVTELDVGGFVITTWAEEKERTNRDLLLVLAGAFAAFIGSFIIDLAMLLNDNVDALMSGKRLF